MKQQSAQMGLVELHINLDEATDTILGFDEDSHIFKAERDVLAANGIDIYSIKRYDDYVEATERFKESIYELVQAKVLNRNNASIEQQYMKAVFRGDDAECKRLFALMQKRQSVGLKSIS